MEYTRLLVVAMGIASVLLCPSRVPGQIIPPVVIGDRLPRPDPIELGDQFGYSIATMYGGYNAPTGIIVGAPGTSNSTGAVYVYTWDDGAWALGAIFLGDQPGDEYGYAVASADVNSDLIDDIIIGVPGANKVHVFDGRTHNRIYRITWEGPPDQVRFGESVAAGQWNGFAHAGFHADIAIGSYNRVDIVYGCNADIALCLGVVDRHLPAEADVVIMGVGENPLVSFLDKRNRDGPDDLLIADRDAGLVYYIEGREYETGKLDLFAPEDESFTFTVAPPISSLAGATVTQDGPLLVAITSPTFVSVFDPWNPASGESSIAILGHGAGDGPILLAPWWRGGDLVGANGYSNIAAGKSGVVFIYSTWRIADPEYQQLEQIHFPVQAANMGSRVDALAAVPETGELVMGMGDASIATVYHLPPKWP